VLSLSATYGFPTGSLGSGTRTSNGGQPTQLSAVPAIEPLPGLAKPFDEQTNPKK
jgi:hypothetical protein